MRHVCLFAVSLGLSTLVASSAMAQSPADDAAAAPQNANGQQLAPAPGVRPANVQPAAPAAPSCGPGVIQGVYPGDAQTGVWLVCEEVRRRAGRPVAVGPSDPPPTYRVGMLRLGNAVVLTLHVESPVGTVRDGRQLRLASIEEVPVAAPRLIDALWQGVPVASTQRVSNLVGEETRKYEKKPGEFLWGLGLIGTYVAGSGGGLEPGFGLRAGYETPRYGIGLDLRGSSGDDSYDDKSASYAAFSVGGRYFLSEGEVGPFVGGGLAYSNIDARGERKSDGSRFYGSGSGMGAYGEVGVEFLRLHSSRLTLDLRFETPFYLVKDEDDAYGYYDPSTDPNVATEPQREDKYMVPVTAGLSYTW